MRVFPGLGGERPVGRLRYTLVCAGQDGAEVNCGKGMGARLVAD
ncbi:hypothetical protein ACFU9B_23285 [Streptomyces sp. NPDC057592]